MSCPLCWHSFEQELTAVLRFQLCGLQGIRGGEVLSGTVSVQVCPNCGLSFFMMPNEPLSEIAGSEYAN